jgi:RNA polymerase sigma-70 factor (ECF subfamily)
MVEEIKYPRLVEQAVAGDSKALGRLLYQHNLELAAYIERQLPANLRSMVEPQDVLQDVYFEVFRRIGTFRPAESEQFIRWLLTIARNRLIDVARHQRAAKRGGERHRMTGADPLGDTTVDLLVNLRVYERTPSSSAMTRETAQRIRECLNRLPKEHREALHLRYFEQHPVAVIASRMQRTEGAVQMLCNRGLKSLRSELLGLLGLPG